MNSFFVWNDKIIFNWDGQYHDPTGIVHEKKDVTLLWKNSGPYMRWSDKFKAYMLDFSQQNMKRLFDDFGKIPVTKGQHIIEDLKWKLSAFKESRARGIMIKNGQYSDSIRYKLPPLAAYQDTGVKMLVNVKRVPLFADCGCIAGDAVIRATINSQTYTKTLDEIFEILKNKKRPAKLSTKVVSLSNTATIKYPNSLRRTFKVYEDALAQCWGHIEVKSGHIVKEIRRMGVKPVLLLTTFFGRTIKATDDHEFLVEGERNFFKWVPLKNIRAGDTVVIVNGKNWNVDAVESVVPAGEQMTYDLVCDDPHRNFIANDFVVHNCGKTFMVLTSTQEQIKRGLISPGKTLVCVKLATIFSGWVKDTQKFTNLRLGVLWAKPGKGRREKILEELNKDYDVYVINHEGVRFFEEELIKKDFQKIVVDESTILKSFRGERAQSGEFGKSLMRVAHKADWRVIMSGTPAPNGPQDLWGQLHFLDPMGFALEASYRDFQQTYMDTIYFGNKNNPNTPKTYKPKANAVVDIRNIVDPLAYRVKIRDHLKDLPTCTIMERDVEMAPEQRAHYLAMKKLKMTIIDDVDIAAPMRLAELAKLRQVTGGFIIDANEVTHPMTENPKLDALDMLVEEEIDTSEKIVIYAQYQWEIRLIEEKYKHHKCVSVYGGNSSAKNLANIESFIEDESVRMIVLHPRSAAHGITFTCAHYMIFYSISYSAEDNYQCIKRIERAGQKNACFVYYLLAKGTIDKTIFAVIEKKTALQSELIDQQVVDEEILKLFKEDL